MTPSVSGPLQGSPGLTLGEALRLRRSRRFGLGMEIPAGPVAFRSRFQPEPLSERETALLIAAATGVTGYSLGIPFSHAETDELPRHPIRLTGRTCPTPAGFATGDLFYTNDDGVWFVATRDVDPATSALARVDDDDAAVTFVRSARRRIADGRLQLRRAAPDIAEHNLWYANWPGSVLIIPVIDLAQQMLAYLSVLVDAGYSLFDDLAHDWAGDLSPFWASGLLDRDRPMPLSEVEHYVHAMAAGEVAMSCFSVSLMQQALGLGGVVFTGISPMATLGWAAADGAPGLGFRFVGPPGGRYPVGLDGTYEALCPPFCADMHEATRRLMERKFGPAGTYRSGHDGPFRRGSGVLSSVKAPSDEHVAAVGTMAQHVLERHGRVPALYPPIFVRFYCQAHHLDLEFYDKHYDNAYGAVHRDHWSTWHPGRSPALRDKEETA